MPPPPHSVNWNKRNLKGGSRGLVYATLHNLPPNNGIPPPTPSTRSVASLPRFGPPPPPLTNPDYTTVTGIAKGHKGPCPPPSLIEIKEI